MERPDEQQALLDCVASHHREAIWPRNSSFPLLTTLLICGQWQQVQGRAHKLQALLGQVASTLREFAQLSTISFPVLAASLARQAVAGAGKGPTAVTARCSLQ